MDNVNLSEERAEKLLNLAANRQLDLAIVLENVHDPHNIGAVIRTCDAVGIPTIFLIVSDARGWNKIELGSRASAGARKWVDVIIYDDCKKCFERLREDYEQIFGTHLAEDSQSLYALDFNKPTAIVFGNEHTGLTEEALSYIDGNFIIPQYGMVQSLNISVACAVSSYEACRQREASGKYNPDVLSQQQLNLLKDYRQRHLKKHKGHRVINPPFKKA